MSELAPEPRAAAASVQALFDRYIAKGRNPEILAFEARVAGAGSSSGRRAANVWKFIEDSVTGAGGFSNGEYLFPFAGEMEGGMVSAKLAQRRAEADYDRFAEHVCNAPWDLIVSCADMISRKTGDADLASFWEDVDRRGTAMTDFLEYPFAQARKYGTGWIFVDRIARELRTQADNRADRPYAYSVPTSDVVDWKFDEDGNLIGIVILEPSPEHVEGNVCPVRVWTLEGWALFTPTDPKGKSTADNFAVTDSGTNELGVIPAIPIFNDTPASGKALGTSEMLDVARLAQTVYNIDSEARETERKCALFLAIPVKNAADYDGGKIVVGTEKGMVYDGEAGEPAWISPDLTILQRLDERRKSKKDAAYEMAHLKALNGGVVETTSGFHAEVEFQKTERRIARHAAMLEATEKRLALLFLRFVGRPDAEFSITYPRDFGVRDMARLIDEVEKITSMNLGETSDRAELGKLFKARHPRKSDEEIGQMVDEAIRARSAAAKQASVVERVKAMAAEARAPMMTRETVQ